MNPNQQNPTDQGYGAPQDPPVPPMPSEQPQYGVPQQPQAPAQDQFAQLAQPAYGPEPYAAPVAQDVSATQVAPQTQPSGDVTTPPQQPSFEAPQMNDAPQNPYAQPVDAQNPVVPPQPQQAAPVQPQNPFGPAPVGGGIPPVGNQPQTAFGGQPMGPQGAPAPKKPFPGKIVGIIAAAVVGLALLAGGAWFLITNVFGGVALERYEGEGYSVLVPKDYEQEDSSTGVQFTSPESEDADENTSGVLVGTMDVPAESREQYINIYKDLYEGSNASDQSGNLMRDVEKTDVTIAGVEGIRVTASVYDDDTKKGDLTMVILFGETKFYMISVAVPESDPALGRVADKIINSFELAES